MLDFGIREGVSYRNGVKRSAGIGLNVLAAVGLAGCTHLSVVPDRSVSGDPGMALSGAPYALPMLQYDITVTRTLTSCPKTVKITDDPADNQYWSGAVAVELTATATPTAVAGERYLIDYSKLDALLKTTNFAIEYQPGTDILKGINVSVEDHSGEVAGNLVKAGLAVAAVASGPAGAGAGAALIGKDVASLAGATKWSQSNYKAMLPPALSAELTARLSEEQALDPNKAFDAALKKVQAAKRQALIGLVGASTKPQQILVCSSQAAADVTARAAAADQLETDTNALKAANAALEKLLKVAAVRGLTTDGRNAMGAAAVQAIDLGTKVEASQAALARLDKRLGLVTNGAWPTSFVDRATGQLLGLSTDERDKFAKLLAPAPVTVRMIDAQALADSLAASPDLPIYRTIAKDFIASYVNDDGTPKSFAAQKALAGCSGSTAATLDAATCMTSLTTLGAALDAVKSDFLPDCPAGAPECRARLVPAAQTGRGDFPRQVPGRTGAPQPGLFVRTPVRATLTICRMASAGEDAADHGCAAPAKSLVKDDKVLAPQLGQLRFFRLVNQMFSNNGLSLSLTKDGAIEKFQYASSKSIAQSLAAAAADAATQAAAFDKQRREEYLKNTDPTALVQQQIDLKTARDKLAALYADPTPDPMKAITLAKAQAEVELLRAQINSLTMQAAAPMAVPVTP